MAEHVYEVLNSPQRQKGPALVDDIASFNRRHHRSFASKYAHFFLDAKQYPIYDQYVLKPLAYHLRNSRATPNSYEEFATWFEQLERLCESSFDLKDLDRYLWLTGAYWRWNQKKENAGLSKDLMKLFESPDPKTQKLLSNLD